MKIGIMQPYFFPYIGYFALINYCDKWIVFDDVQYIRKGWMNRNRIIHPTKPDFSYINVPIQKSTRDTKIKDILIDNDSNYKKRICDQLKSSYGKRAPYYVDVMKVIEEAFERPSKSLVELNVNCLEVICSYLKIKFDYEIFSSMEITIDEVNDAGEWALEISSAVNAKTYINPPGGVELFDDRKFTERGIELKFLKSNITEYNQKKKDFISGLSIIDVIMFNDVKTVKTMLADYSLYGKSEAL